MKKSVFIFIIIVLGIIAIILQVETYRLQSEISLTNTPEEPQYSIRTDSFVNRLLDSEPIETNVHEYVATKGKFNYQIKYKECLFDIYEEPKQPYHSPGKWMFFATLYDGRNLMINPTNAWREHRISQLTLRRIKLLCLKLKEEHLKNMTNDKRL